MSPWSQGSSYHLRGCINTVNITVVSLRRQKCERAHMRHDLFLHFLEQALHAWGKVRRRAKAMFCPAVLKLLLGGAQFSYYRCDNLNILLGRDQNENNRQTNLWSVTSFYWLKKPYHSRMCNCIFVHANVQDQAKKYNCEIEIPKV